MQKTKKRTRYTEKRLRRRNVRFRLCYLALLCLLAFGMYKVYGYIDKSLTAYEAAQPSHVAEEMGRMFTEKRFDEMFECEDASCLTLETREDYIAYVKALTDGAKIEYKEVFSKDAGVRKFAVTSDGKSFASFSIRKTGQTADCGFLKVDLYEPYEIATSILQPVAYEVTIPELGALYVNGEALPKEYVVESGIKIFASGHLPDSVPSTDLCVYRFTCALGAPEIAAVDVAGEAYLLTETAQNTYAYAFPYRDEELRPGYEPHIIEAAKAICMYTTENTSITRVLKYMLADSSAANYMNNMDSTWLTKADKYSFSDFVTENYATFSDTLFCCDVRFEYTTVSKGVTNVYPIAYRFYYEQINGNWLLYDFQFL